MNAYLDNDPLSVLPRPSLSVADVLADARRRLSGTNRLIVAVRLDDVETTADALDAAVGQNAALFARIDIESADPRLLAADVVRQAGDLFEAVIDERPGIAEALSRGQTADAMQRLTQCFAAWAQTYESIGQSAILLQIDLASLDCHGQPVEAVSKSVADMLRRLRDALRNGDHVAVADIWEYEIEEALSGWRDVIAAMARRIDSWVPAAA